jgi:hypothetical protein
VSDESLSQFTPRFHATKSIHFFVKLIEPLFGLLAGMSETCSPLAAFGPADVYIIARMKLLCLRALIDFEIIKAKVSSTADPGIVNQQRRCPVVAVRVDRPMCDYNVGVFGLQNFGEVSIPVRGYLRIAVNLPGKYRPRPQNRTSLLALGRANGCGLRRALAWDPRFPASQVKYGNIVPQIGI